MSRAKEPAIDSAAFRAARSRTDGQVMKGRHRTGKLAQVVEELAPGGRLVSTRRLRGGIGARMQVLDVERRDGTRFKVSLRRFEGEDRHSTPEHVTHEYKILQLVEKSKIQAPRPLILDADGRWFGVPAIVLSYLPGRPQYTPRDVTFWAGQLAQALTTIHNLPTQGLSWLSLFNRESLRDEILRRKEEVQGDPLARDVHAVLEAEIDTISWPKPTFVHDDFWPGNTVWRYDRLVGVIDWTSAKLGDARADVSQCRADLALSHGPNESDAFLNAYQARVARPLPEIWYFDLVRGLRALLYYKLWLDGYHDAGLTHLTSSLARRRITAFLHAALLKSAR